MASLYLRRSNRRYLGQGGVYARSQKRCSNTRLEMNVEEL